MKHMTMTSFGTCSDCGKRRWPSRRAAKKAARRIHPGEQLHVYPCPTSNGFHLGHLRPAVVHGRITRAEAYRRKTA